MNDKLPAEPSADQPRWPADRSTAALATALEAAAADLRRLNLTLPASTEAHLKLHLMGGTDQVRREQTDALNAALGLGEAEGREVGPAIHYGTGYEGVAHEGGLAVITVAIVAPLVPPTDERDAEIARLRAELAEARTGQGYSREVDNGDPAAVVPAGVDGTAMSGRPVSAAPAGDRERTDEYRRRLSQLARWTLRHGQNRPASPADIVAFRELDHAECQSQLAQMQSGCE